ncbi:hypothetical protein PGT21_031448 [Puccinia graminis f. sp. tritici]|uniref:Uncharacterized protein n=1 Tax=Puccinia graminis f. sp. tritici TaxID=56615 RepID=A0A5B0LPY3_PUCGR|nr:hypothetical protein PGT21_031448 [Puccinia graminis f. sp. tritici]
MAQEISSHDEIWAQPPTTFGELEKTSARHQFQWASDFPVFTWMLQVAHDGDSHEVDDRCATGNAQHCIGRSPIPTPQVDNYWQRHKLCRAGLPAAAKLREEKTLYASARLLNWRSSQTHRSVEIRRSDWVFCLHGGCRSASSK